MALTRRDALKLGGLAAVALKGENPVVGGTVLRRAAIESPNFVTGSTGWIIRQDGSAEFNNVVIRNGEVISGTALYYNGAPALGTLVASVAFTSGTDSFGQPYLDGVTTYFLSGPTNIAVQMALGEIAFWSSATIGGAWSQLSTISSDQSGDIAVTLLNASTGLSLTLAAGGSTVINATNAGDEALGIQLTTDSHARFKVNGNGGVNFSDGAHATDTTFGRIAAGEVGATSNTSLAVATAGQGLRIAEGSNAKQGVATLVAGSVVVANTSVTANSKIFVGQNTPGGTVGAPFVSSVTAGTGFTIKSTSNLDTSTVGYFITEPA